MVGPEEVVGGTRTSPNAEAEDAGGPGILSGREPKTTQRVGNILRNI